MYVVVKFESFWKKKEFPIAHIYIYIYISLWTNKLHEILTPFRLAMWLMVEDAYAINIDVVDIERFNSEHYIRD